MNNIKILIALLISLVMTISCKDDLDVENPNQPNSGAIRTETGIVSFGMGIYITGFKDVKYYDGVPGYFWSGTVGNHDLMGDVIGTDIANVFINQIGCPDNIVLDDGTNLVNPNAPSKQIDFIRITANVNSTGFQNSTYYEWAYMYNINNACNTILSNVDQVAYTGEAEVKKNTLKAWAYWWKGFAYSRIGSLYYAGLIVNEPNGEEVNGTNGNYVTKEEIINEATRNFDLASSALASIPAGHADYNAILSGLIPSFNRTGKGGLLSPVMWQHNINTYKARNILVNRRVNEMTTEHWNQILTLTENGITATDLVFTGRSNSTSDFLAPTTGTVSAKTSGLGNTFKITERLIQDFKPGDKRMENNFKLYVNSKGEVSPYIGETSRGNSFFTRWQLINSGADGAPKMPGVIQFCNNNVGAYELYLAGSYEENMLMRAEALIYTGLIDDGLTLIDQVRTLQGAGLSAVSGTGLTLDQAKEELRRERRIGLLFRSLAFYDARRWGVIDNVSAGGGRKAAIALSRTGVVSTNATVNYNYLDYWDVPDNELAYNPPLAGSALVKNPKGM
ncbi:RagB/SusD family nutrient uptake outer membrane protein [Chryseosolibacter indicus]|uniref:RagB/SusD family nutrient uptake outer membrane protein n=1 Tax=Chryseosolibacter indicus TaxID=2782351 RepID=A0ABS5VS50_9BACT|nr:RagB/SusD family nutrient uptake outer membrane protein [Chryseosolibacter indicus]MBT1704265.1 RagB/SusD family nutrient uptake outer membrane protein [Chryseosolibacter indicus]